MRITPRLSVDDRHITVTFVRASGPGGQNVNKVSSAVELRFDAQGADLPPAVLQRLSDLAGRRMTGEGVLVIDAQRHRSQELNRQDALERLRQLLIEAAREPIRRVKTRPTLGSKLRRVAEKQVRAGVKRGRGRVSAED